MCISKEELNTFCREIFTEYGITLAICEIFGKRWSYIAGSGENLFAGTRIHINHKYGVVVDELPDYLHEDIVLRIKRLLKADSL